jgi:hypothetical protein
MVCEHLRSLDNELAALGVKETFRGQAWTNNCREWVYYDCYLDRDSLRARMKFDQCVKDHEHIGTHDGQEAGFVCKLHNDAIMGVHESYRNGKITIK